jgi:uncharacterized protein (DUF885 family)
MTATSSPFATLAGEFLAETFRLDPLRATDAGNHEHDDRWPDWTKAGRQERLQFADRWTDRLRALADADLTVDERVDRDLLLGELAALRFAEAELRQDAWDPYAWVEAIGTGLFLLLAREFAPPVVRLTALAGRLESLPAVIDAAVEALTGLPGVPVSRLHAETALSQLPGVTLLVDEAVAMVDGQSADDEVSAIAPRIRDSAALARTAIERFERHLRQVVLPGSEGDGRLGKERFRGKLEHTLRDAELTAEVVLEHAEREAGAVRDEMVRLARKLWPARVPDRPVPDDDQALVREVLDSIAAEHPTADGQLDACRAALDRIERFCRDRQIIGLPEEPLAIDWAPVFLRGFGGAMLWSPGPLDRHLPALFLITPVPEDWTDEERESWLRESNTRQIALLTIHEAVPGHYLQGVRANQQPSLLRVIFGSGVFAEGWAVYVTQAMIDAGFADDDPALQLVHWKFYLRAALNAILDVRVHTMDMTEDEAIKLLVETGFQEESEARNKFKRARLTSAQLSTYFVGSLGLWQLDREARRRAAAAVGVPAPALADGLPGVRADTPGFDRRAHLDAVLAHGTPPIPLLRRLVLGD